MLLGQALVGPESVNSELEKVGRGQIALVLAPPQRLPRISMQALLHFCGSPNRKAVYVSVTRPGETLWADLEREGVPRDRLVIVDCVSAANAPAPRVGPGLRFVDSPGSLTEISILVDKALTEFGGPDTLVLLDSIATMLNWNSFENLAKFLVLMTAKIRKRQAAGLMLMPGNHEERLLTHVAPICDHVIRVADYHVLPVPMPPAGALARHAADYAGAALRFVWTALTPNGGKIEFSGAARRVSTTIFDWIGRRGGTHFVTAQQALAANWTATVSSWSVPRRLGGLLGTAPKRPPQTSKPPASFPK